jgi:hypothetical protein
MSRQSKSMKGIAEFMLIIMKMLLIVIGIGIAIYLISLVL